MSIDFKRILKFIGENADKGYQKVEKINDYNKKIQVEKMKNDATKMLEEWKLLYPYFKNKGYTYNAKTASQWLDGSNTKVKSYLWLPLKKIGKEQFNTSISIFAELIKGELRFRVSIEIDDKKSNKDEYLNHNRYLEFLYLDNKNFDYFGSKNSGLEIEVLEKEEVSEFIDKVKSGQYNKIQAGKYFTENHIKNITDDEFLNELDSTVNELEEYYDIAVEEVDSDKSVENVIKEDNLLFDNVSKINQQIHKYINSKGFIYNDKDLNNFYLSLKTKPFVILAGVSGTGKSKLIKLFANAIGANSENGQYNVISVKPDWNDSTELFGYKNINDEFIPGQLTKIIHEASKDENINKPYFVCLDEMNLARVEYYLSEYLSIIESREFKGEKIETDQLFIDEDKGKEIKKNNEYSGLRIPENLYIIGTVNMDDTTFSFSRKVLDRANTIEFSDVDLENLDFGQAECEPINLENSFLKTNFINIKESLDNDEDFVKEVNKKIVTINDILKKGNKNFGYRVRDEIVFYMLENNIVKLLDEDIAFDFQIMQKILPTITGSESAVKKILIDLFNYCIKSNDGEVDKVLNGTLYISHCEKELESKSIRYRKSAEKILMMLRRYDDGFTSFWA